MLVDTTLPLLLILDHMSQKLSCAKFMVLGDVLAMVSTGPDLHQNSTISFDLLWTAIW